MTNFLATLLENIKTLFSSLLTLLTLLACGILLIAFIKFKSIKFNAQLMARIGLALALAIILDMIKLYTFPNGGGSVSLGSMIPIFIISYAYGPSVGIFTGFLFGLLKLMFNPYILSPIQVLFDYPLPFMAVGIAGFFKDKKINWSYCRDVFKICMSFYFWSCFLWRVCSCWYVPYNILISSKWSCCRCRTFNLFSNIGINAFKSDIKNT